MVKTRDNHLGFSVIEVFLLIVLITIVSLIGWSIYNSQSQNDTSTSANQLNSNNEPKDLNVKDAYSGWNQYSLNKIYFKYPNDWVLPQKDIPVVKSPDYTSTGKQVVTVTKGSSVSFYETGIPKNDITVDNYQNSSQYVPPSDFGYEKVLIGSETVGRYYNTNNRVVTIFFKSNGTKILATLDYAPEDKENSIKTYELILSSFKTN